MRHATEYASFAFDQVASLIYSVHLPREYLPPSIKEGAEEPEPAAAPAQIALWRDNVWERLNALKQLRAQASAGAAGHTWQNLEALLQAADELSAACIGFIDAMTSAEWEERFRQNFELIETWLRRRQTVGIGLLVSVALLGGVEPARSLALNQGFWLLVPIAFVALPLAVHQALARRLQLRWGLRAFRDVRVLDPEATLARWPHGSPFRYRMTQRAIRSFGLLLGGLSVAGGTLFAASRLLHTGTSFVTVFICFSLVVLSVRVCHYLDRWDFIDERPIRARALAAGLTSALLMVMGWFWVLAALFAGIGAQIFWVLHKGGAPRWLKYGVASIALAACATALRGQKLSSDSAWRDPEGSAAAASLRVPAESWPFPGDEGPVVLVAASGGGSRAAIYTAKTLLHLERELPELARRLQAISSVSGGSLGSAAYIARRAGRRSLDDLELAVGQDFLLPTLLGALNPWSSRGASLEQYWQHDPDGPGFGELKISELTRAWLDARGKQPFPPFPMPLFNSCTLDGHAVVISPLPQGLYTRADNSRLQALYEHYDLDPATDVATWVVDRDAIYGFESILENADPLLASAVRASANFPFGFPLVEIETRADRLFLSPNNRFFGASLTPSNVPPETVRLTDGGVLSNSGMWSLFQLMMNEVSSDPNRKTALQRRGVLLIIVEASKMPEYADDRRSILSLYGLLGDKNPVSQALHRRMFDLLKLTYGPRLAIVQLDLIPQQKAKSYNVYTTWALDPVSKEKLDESFEKVWGATKGSLKQKFEKLQRGEDPGEDVLLRPPLD